MKRFLLKSLLYSIPIITPIVLFTIFINPHLHGDIGPRGYITFADDYGKYNLPTNNKVVNCEYNYNNFSDSCILTIGDSFSQTNIASISYNYFLANYTNYKVVNLSQQCYTVSPFTRFMYFSKTRRLPKIVILETVERRMVERLCKLTLSQSAETMLTRHYVDTTISTNNNSKNKTIFEKTQEYIKRNLHLSGYENPIKSSVLNKVCFTCADKESSLYFYEDDVNQLPMSDSLLNLAIIKLDSLYDYADSLGIELYVLIAADKYDVYQDYIVDNPYPQQNVLERFYAMYPHPRMINSKDTLSQMIANDVMDVYWCNNTHWSPIGSKAVAEQLAKTINRCENDTIFSITQ